MLSLLAAAILTSSEPSAAGLAERFVQVQQSLPGEQPAYAGWSRPQLEGELERLENARPSIGVPIAMLVSGIAVGAVDVVVFFFSSLFALIGGTGFTTPMIVGIIAFAVGAAGLIIVAAVFLRAALRERAEHNKQIDLVRETIERRGDPPPPEEQIPLPPNPPQNPFPGPQVQLTPPWFTVTLARF